MTGSTPYDKSTWQTRCDASQHNNPYQKVVFLKTHKTASSSLATTFIRYADEKHLQLAMPFGFSAIFNEKRAFQHGMVLSLGDMGLFDFMAGHARYNRPEMDRVVTAAKYVTILRDPVGQLESAFSYFRMAENIGNSGSPDPLGSFLNRPDFYFHNYEYDRKEQSWNGQIYDLGLDHRYHINETAITDKIKQLDRELDLVLMTEYYDESMILLRRLLCWDWMDIVYLAKAIRKNSLRRKEISPELAARIRLWNSADVKLYDHFNKTFWQRVAQYGADEFDADLSYYRKLNHDISQQCLDLSRSSHYDDRIEAYRLADNAPTFCSRLIRETIPYVRRLKFRYVCSRLIGPAVISVTAFVLVVLILLLTLRHKSLCNHHLSSKDLSKNASWNTGDDV